MIKGVNTSIWGIVRKDSDIVLVFDLGICPSKQSQEYILYIAILNRISFQSIKEQNY